MELNGTIKKIEETKSIGTSNFKKRDLVIETKEQYPQSILVSFHQDKCDILNNYKKCDEVKIGINLRGREWVNKDSEVKYFNEIVGWKINKANETTPTNENLSTEEAKERLLDQQNLDVENNVDDLPF